MRRTSACSCIHCCSQCSDFSTQQHSAQSVRVCFHFKVNMLRQTAVSLAWPCVQGVQVWRSRRERERKCPAPADTLRSGHLDLRQLWVIVSTRTLAHFFLLILSGVLLMAAKWLLLFVRRLVLLLIIVVFVLYSTLPIITTTALKWKMTKQWWC